MLNIGQHIDRYVVEGKLGEGGMAEVYRVRHATLNTAHALKVLTLTDATVRDRLVREGRMQAQLVHENVVQVTDVLSIGGQPGLLMEFVEGPTLEQWLNRYRPTVAEATIIFRALCTGVGYAHHRGLVHRDLKPSNVLLSITDDRIVPKVADFGLARQLDPRTSGPSFRHTRVGVTMGTPGYMPPEQIRDASSVDRRADLWSLGCILYRMVCGVPAFDAEDLIELFAQVGSGDYVPSRLLRPDLPERIHHIIDGTLRVKLEERVGDCGLLLEYLDGNTDALDLTFTARPRLPGSDRPRALTRAEEALSVARAIVEETLLGLPKLEREVGWPHRPQEASVGVGPRLGPGSEPPLEPSPPSQPDHPWFRDSLPERKPGPTLIAPPPSPGLLGRLWMVFSLGLAVGSALLLVLLGVGGIWMFSQSELLARPPRVAEGTAPTPAPAPPMPAEIREPEPQAPVRPVEPEPGEVRPVRPAPAPGGPVAPAVPPTVEETFGRVRFVGADEVWLEGPLGPVRDLEHVPPGHYKVMARFPDSGPVVAAPSVSVRAGKPMLLTCVAAFARCKAGEE